MRRITKGHRDRCVGSVGAGDKGRASGRALPPGHALGVPNACGRAEGHGLEKERGDSGILVDSIDVSVGQTGPGLHAIRQVCKAGRAGRRTFRTRGGEVEGRHCGRVLSTGGGAVYGTLTL